MKTVLRRIFIYTFGLFLLELLVPGVNIKDSLLILFMGGVFLAGMYLIPKPVFNLLTFPVSFISASIISILMSAIILYLLTVFSGSIGIEAFTYPRTDFLGVIIPKLTFSTFLAYIYSAFVLSCIDSFLSWLME